MAQVDHKYKYMTPSLLGRIQTRLFLNIVVGLPIALFFSAVNLLFVMSIFGVGWDAIYMFFQNKRFDRDWPPILMFTAGLIEWIFPWVIVILIFPQSADQLIVMYWLIWILSFAMQLGPLNVLFPKRRFKSGRIL